jgi:large subunit ribosomal protein L25
MESVLVAEKRDDIGKAAVRRLRRTGKVPVIIYGEDIEPKSLSIDSHDLEMLIRKDVSVITLKIDNKDQDAIIRDIQYHPVKGQIIHVDFLTLQKGHKVEMTIPVHFEGTPKGAKVGGNFSIMRHEVMVLVLPKDIPDFIPVDVSELEIGDSIRIKDLNAGEMEFLDNEDDSICHVVAPKAVEETTEGEEELLGSDEDSAEPEVITARKEDGEE